MKHAVMILLLTFTPLVASAATIQSTVFWAPPAEPVPVEVQRRDDPGTNYTTLATVPAGTSAHVDSGQPAGAAFCYRARPVNVIGPGPWTADACTATPTTPPPLGGFGVSTTVVP